MSMLVSKQSDRRSLADDQHGAAMAEMAMIALPFFMIILTLIEFGYRSYVGIVADSVAHELARSATAGTLELDDLQGRAEEALDPLLLTDAELEVTTRSYFDFTGVGRPEQFTHDANGDGNLDEGDCFFDENANATLDDDVGIAGLGGADDAVVYSLTIVSPKLTGISQLFGSEETDFNVLATATGRNQPFDDQVERNPVEHCVIGGISVPV